MSKERYMTEEEMLENVPNAFPIDKSDNSEDNENKAGAQISEETNKGTRTEDLDPIPADAEAGEYREPTHYDNGVGQPDKSRKHNTLTDESGYRALTTDEAAVENAKRNASDSEKPMKATKAVKSEDEKQVKTDTSKK